MGVFSLIQKLFAIEERNQEPPAGRLAIGAAVKNPRTVFSSSASEDVEFANNISYDI